MYECCPTAVIEIESVDALLQHVRTQGAVHNVVVQGLDLRDADVEAALLDVAFENACLLGCDMSDALEAHVRATGGTIFPTFTGVPFHPYRASLYTPQELMTGYERGDEDSLRRTVDRAIYDYFTERTNGHDTPVMDALAFRIHDHAIDDALRDLLGARNGGRKRRVVGIMGGHRLPRDHDVYRAVARLGWRLARDDFFVATGGGPGAMEAANLGAALATCDADAVDDAVNTLSVAPHYDDAGYFETAFDVLDRYPERAESLAIPTWFYGHEPSNLFPTHVAKYFANSIREDGLLAIAQHGVIYAPGSAGTIQEIFMDAAQNHYETFGDASPMVFFGQDYWTETKPVYPLMQTLATGTPYDGLLTLTDDVDAAVDAIVQHAATRDDETSTARH